MPSNRAFAALLVGALAMLQTIRPARAAEPEALSFDEAIARALARNPAARSAQQDLVRAEALLMQSRAPALPSLSAGGTYTRIDKERTLPGSPATPTAPASPARVVQGAESVAANITLAVPILAASRWAQWSHAAENVDLTRLAAADVGRTVALTTARAWLTVLAQHRVVDANERANRTAQAHLDYARGRRAGGVGTRLDEVRADQTVQSTTASLESARTALARSREALGVLVGSGAPVDVAGDAQLAQPPSVDEALEEATSERTDIKALKARRQAASHASRDSWLDYLPTLTAQGQPFYQNPATLTQPKTGWTAQLILALPIFEGGLRVGQARERTAIEEQTALAVEAGERQANSEVRAAAEALQRADAALAATRRSAQLAHEALDLATEAYRAGATTNLDVIDAERSALDADTSAAIAEDAARQARLDLLAAAGRFPQH